ncbi:DUF7144 family membrane protein [Agromyces sp. Marseille-Q5079]|uniref:DUF7144 family membrane protein n=1 Tax=Agromyces sp. Marseille-Q5079 TaxID=3439059 RepID=UPI003D9C9696
MTEQSDGTTTTEPSQAPEPSRPASHRPPAELLAAVVLGYLNGVTQIISGIALMFSRYLPDTSEAERLVITVVGACTVLLGLFMITIASGLTRGRRDARVLVTVLLAIALALDVVSLIASPDQWFVIAELVLAAAAVTVLWTGRTARFFARSAGARTG